MEISYLVADSKFPVLGFQFGDPFVPQRDVLLQGQLGVHFQGVLSGGGGFEVVGVHAASLVAFVVDAVAEDHPVNTVGSYVNEAM